MWIQSRVVIVLFVILSAMACARGEERAGAEGRGASDSIRPWAERPRYWQYKGKPVMLLGGSREDNLYQIPDLEEHLDLLASVGGNYVRNTMSSRDEGNVQAFRRRDDGKYDLEQLNDEHYERFERLLRLARERDVIVQIELWDRFDYAQEQWQDNPYRPANNVNYTAKRSGLRNEYPNHPNKNDNPFFRSEPAEDNNALLLKYQHAQVDRMLSISLKYPNVLYCMDNETAANAEWGAYWAEYIRRKAAEAGVEAQVTEMWDAWNVKEPVHRRTLDHPERYTFVDISQNNHNKGQRHWDNLQWAWGYVAERPRPINHVKIYGADSGKYGNDRDGVERFWRGIVGGAASVRFHRPPSGLGLSEKAQAHLRSARMLLAEFDVFHAVPDSESRRFSEREDGEAYLSFIEGKHYAVFFPDGGKVRLDLGADAADSTGETPVPHVRWLDTAKSAWRESSDAGRDGKIELEAPGKGPWVALIRK